MRFLLDQNQSPRLVELLTAAGHDAIHVSSISLSTASDTRVMDAALEDDRVLVSADTDFGELLARTNASGPPSFCCGGRNRDGQARCTT